MRIRQRMRYSALNRHWWPLYADVCVEYLMYFWLVHSGEVKQEVKEPCDSLETVRVAATWNVWANTAHSIRRCKKKDSANMKPRYPRGSHNWMGLSKSCPPLGRCFSAALQKLICPQQRDKRRNVPQCWQHCSGNEEHLLEKEHVLLMP